MQNVFYVFEIILDEIILMGPYFLGSVLFGALVKTYKIDRRFYSFFNSSPFLSVIIATLAGIISPLCSCGILPVFITLLDIGAPLSASLSLLVVSPIMSPDAFIITWGGLGYKMALIKVFGAVIIGLFTGFIFLYLEKINFFKKGILKSNIYREDKSVCRIRSKDGSSPSGRLPVDIELAEDKLNFFYKRAKELFVFIGKFILLAFIIEAIIAVYVPYEWVEIILGEKGAVSVFNAVLIGIPLPVNGISVVNVLKGLIEKGMSNGAAVAFLFAGPVTALPAIIALSGMVEKKVVWVFLIIGILISFLLGLTGQII